MDEKRAVRGYGFRTARRGFFELDYWVAVPVKLTLQKISAVPAPDTVRTPPDRDKFPDVTFTA